MTSPYKYLIIENIEKLRKIIINNPARKNALPLEAYQELTGEFEMFIGNKAIACTKRINK